ncbi:alpha/beta-hydrolase [Aulographum hederae CBS 113979]|uniref:Alpha/beta-hydrolase n=1 Tax=Aulographum hederae CBS 113979 TaxID=1176131 RepID=A0A6G1GZF4_9PEZI|nr:alpha/beta-hydrolase [Aulographum hederae CBS 113979]
MSLQESTSKQSGLEIAFTRLPPSLNPGDNESSHPTIVFLHGSESCHLEFSRVAPFLSDDYQLLLVDLPGHSRSKAIPFSFDNAINALSHLIRTHVEGGKAHIVGLSLGGIIGLEFARRCPELVLSLWGTGCAPSSGWRLWLLSQSRLLSGIITVAGHLATEKIFWATFPGVEPIPGLRAEVKNNQNMTLLKPVFDELVLVTLENLAEIRGVRIAIIAGGKQDNIKNTVEAGKVLRSQNSECNAFVVRKAIHWWSLQLPELFAQGVRAWIERSEIPKEYEPLLTTGT